MFDGGRMRDIRQSQHMTQEYLSEKLNIHVNTIRRWEQDKQVPDANKLAALASALNTTVAYLTGETDAPGRVEAGPREPAKEETATPRAKVEDRGTLSYTFGNGEKLELPATPEYTALFKEMVAQRLSAGKGE